MTESACRFPAILRGTIVMAILATVTPWPAAARQQAPTAPECKPAGQLARVPELAEGSGVAASRTTPGRLWAHNDSGEPVLFALNDRGAVTARVTVTGAAVDDWEAIAVGPCAGGSCLYVGDIGDNDAKRKRITLYRFPEPESGATAAAARDVIHATYPDGPHDAEALLVSPGGDVFVVTKGDTGPVALYRFPRNMQAGGTVALERVGKPRDSGKPGSGDRITDGAVSPNGTWVVLRTNGALSFYRMSDLMAGNWREAGRIDLGPLGEPQGEGVAFGDDRTLYLVGEGGGKSQPGTVARLACTF